MEDRIGAICLSDEICSGGWNFARLEKLYKVSMYEEEDSNASLLFNTQESENYYIGFLEQNKWLEEIVDAPTFYPSLEEFADPAKYIQLIEPEASKFGELRLDCIMVTSRLICWTINRTQYRKNRVQFLSPAVCFCLAYNQPKGHSY